MTTTTAQLEPRSEEDVIRICEETNFAVKLLFPPDKLAEIDRLADLLYPDVQGCRRGFVVYHMMHLGRESLREAYKLAEAAAI